jgi:hypothetical protein
MKTTERTVTYFDGHTQRKTLQSVYENENGELFFDFFPLREFGLVLKLDLGVLLGFYALQAGKGGLGLVLSIEAPTDQDYKKRADLGRIAELEAFHEDRKDFKAARRCSAWHENRKARP